MMTLEQIEKENPKHLHTVADYKLSMSQLATRPERVDDRDIAIIKFFGGERRANEAIARRDAAVRSKADPPPAPAAEETTVVERILIGLHKFVEDMNERNKERNAKIAALEEKVAALEARPPSLEYKGVFTEGNTYPKGSVCTRRGGLWLALVDTTLSPGSNPGAWRLIVKSGSAEQ